MTVFLLLSILVVQGSGCDNMMKNLLDIIKNDPDIFRRVFPKDYNITHHYSDSLPFGSDPCDMVSVAHMLWYSWSRLRLNLWDKNIHHKFIMELEENLYSVSREKFRESPDPSVYPPVSSTPEELLNFTRAFFSTWLNEKCPSPVELCEFPFPKKTQKEGKKSDRAPFNATPGSVAGEKIPLSGLPATSLATSTHLSVSYIFWCFLLLWTVL